MPRVSYAKEGESVNGVQVSLAHGRNGRMNILIDGEPVAALTKFGKLGLYKELYSDSLSLDDDGKIAIAQTELD